MRHFLRKEQVKTSSCNQIFDNLGSIGSQGMSMLCGLYVLKYVCTSTPLHGLLAKNVPLLFKKYKCHKEKYSPIWKINILVREHPCLSVLERPLDHTRAEHHSPLAWNPNLGQQQRLQNTNWYCLIIIMNETLLHKWYHTSYDHIGIVWYDPANQKFVIYKNVFVVLDKESVDLKVLVQMKISMVWGILCGRPSWHGWWSMSQKS